MTEESKIPWDISERQYRVLSGIFLTLYNNNSSIESLGREVPLLFHERDQDEVDTVISFNSDSIVARFMLQPIAIASNEVKSWLGSYHERLKQRLRSDDIKPVIENCFIEIHFSEQGVRYFLTYICAHADNSLAQGVPQGLLFRQRPLNFSGVGNQQMPAPRQKRERPGKEAAWI